MNADERRQMSDISFAAFPPKFRSTSTQSVKLSTLKDPGSFSPRNALSLNSFVYVQFATVC